MRTMKIEKLSKRSVNYCIKKKRVNAIVMGDFNSIVGEGSTDKVVGLFGLGKRNERDNMLINRARILMT